MVIMAAALRFAALPPHYVWQDEAITLLHASGYTGADLQHMFAHGRIRTVEEMRPLQGIGSPRTPRDVVNALAAEDPQHPPVYYLTIALVQHLFQGSVLSARIASALIGVMLIPAMYWLGFELFRSKATAATSAVLIAVSPFFVTYSRELREYELFALVTILASAVMLRAESAGRVRWWVLYGLTCTVGLYTDMLFAFTLLGHVVYLVGAHRRFSLSGIAAAIAAAILYLPWLIAVSAASGTVSFTNEWSTGVWPFGMLLEKWMFNAGTVFFDLEYAQPWLSVFLVPIVSVAILALVHIARRAKAPEKWFVGALGLPLIVLFAGGDIVLHAHRSAVTRYGVLLYITLLLCTAAFFTDRWRNSHRAWRAIAACILLAAFASDLTSARHAIWWNNHQDAEVISIAQRINADERPLVVSPSDPHLLYMLSFLLRNDVRLRLVDPREKPQAFQRNTFVLATRDDARDFAARRPHMRLVLVYSGTYDAAWQTFHRPLKPADAAATGMNGAKLSLWRIEAAGLDRAANRRIVAL